MIPKSGNRFADKIMLQQKSMIPKSMPWTPIRGGIRFPAFAKPASAGEARSDEIMLQQRDRVSERFERGAKHTKGGTVKAHTEANAEAV